MPESSDTSPQSNMAADFTAGDPTLSQNAETLLSLLVTALIESVSHSGGKRLASQFEQQLSRFAREHGYSTLTSRTGQESALSQTDVEILIATHRSYAQYAQSLAERVLGKQLLHSALKHLVDSLPPEVQQVNAKYEFICLPQARADQEKG